MPHPSDPELLVLHGLRLKSFASAEVLAAATGLALDVVTGSLEQFRDKEWVRHRDGAITGWMLLAAGRAEGERRVHDELDQIGARAEIDADYRQFLTFNQPLLQVCTDWQLRPVEGQDDAQLNDHSDATYDENVVGVLRSLDQEVQPIVASLASVLDRFAGYGPRLHHALQQVVAGEHDWFTKPTIDSYHTVWFELHENLLSTLGIERGHEEPA